MPVNAELREKNTVYRPEPKVENRAFRSLLQLRKNTLLARMNLE